MAIPRECAIFLHSQEILRFAQDDKLIIMEYQHKQLAQGRWFDMSVVEQLANVGSEVERTILWKKKNNPDYSNKAFVRALELLDLTVEDAKNKSRLKEILRLREALVDYFVFDNQFSSSDESWRKYFYSFNFAARITRIKR